LVVLLLEKWSGKEWSEGEDEVGGGEFDRCGGMGEGISDTDNDSER
jgi:hypothetical protein